MTSDRAELRLLVTDIGRELGVSPGNWRGLRDFLAEKSVSTGELDGDVLLPGDYVPGPGEVHYPAGKVTCLEATHFQSAAIPGGADALRNLQFVWGKYVRLGMIKLLVFNKAEGSREGVLLDIVSEQNPDDSAKVDYYVRLSGGKLYRFDQFFDWATYGSDDGRDFGVEIMVDQRQITLDEIAVEEEREGDRAMRRAQRVARQKIAILMVGAALLGGWVATKVNSCSCGSGTNYSMRSN